MDFPLEPPAARGGDDATVHPQAVRDPAVHPQPARDAAVHPEPAGTWLKAPGAVLLVSCYELGRQPIAVASASSALASAGYTAAAIDLAVDRLTPEVVGPARLAVVFVPMHTALRIGMNAAAKIRSLNPACRITFCGTYAALNADALFQTGADCIISGEFEEPLVNLVTAFDAGAVDGPVPGVRTRNQAGEAPWLKRITFTVPRRDSLPALDRYARLEIDGVTRVAGHTETSRGCRHLCRHCSLPPVYGGRFFVVPRDVVMADIENQVRAGATHITFGDADFLNGPGHAIAIARALPAQFPGVTFDFTAKIEHLLKYADLVREMGRLGCLFVISAVESLNDHVLEILAKDHTRADVKRALALTRDAGIALRPTWVPFTPWTTLADYLDILDFIETEDLIDAVDPIQLTVRLLVPPGSLLVDHPEMKPHLAVLPPGAISRPWSHPDPRMDQLQADVTEIVRQAADGKQEAPVVFQTIKRAAIALAPAEAGRYFHAAPRPRRRVPRLTEPWFC